MPQMKQLTLALLYGASFCALLPTAALALSGQVYRDYDGDSVRDALEPLTAGVTVTAYGLNNTACGSFVTTGATAPNFSFTPSAAAGNCTVATYRIEFTGLPIDASGIASGTGTNSDA